MHFAFLFLVIAGQMFGLTSSNVVTLPTLNPYSATRDPSIAVNEQGDLAVIWNDLKESGGDREVVKLTLKQSSQWTEPAVISNGDDLPENLQCWINATGTITAFWQTHDEERNNFYRTRFPACENIKLHHLQNEHYIRWPTLTANGKFLFFSFTYYPKTSRTCDGYSVFNSIEMEPWSLENNKQVIGISQDFIPEYRLATNRKGEHFVLWQKSSENDENHTVFAGAWRGENGEWTSIEEFSFPDYCFSIRNITIDAQDNIWVVLSTFNSTGGGEAFWMLRGSSSGEWSQPGRLIQVKGNVENIDLASSPSGDLLLIWETFEKKINLYSSYKHLDQSWSSAIQLASFNQLNFGPILKEDGKGRFLLVWQEVTQKMGFSIHGATFSPTTLEWSHSQQLSPQDEDCKLSSCVLNSNGVGAVMWNTMADESFLQVLPISMD